MNLLISKRYKEKDKHGKEKRNEGDFSWGGFQ